MTAVHMSKREFEALGLSLPDDEAVKPAPVIKRIEPLPALPDFSAMMPRSQVYQVVASLLALSEAVYGAPIVKHDALARTWDIRTGQTTAYRVQIEPLATIIVTYSKADKWQAGEQRRYPALPMHEQFRLFYGGKVGA